MILYRVAGLLKDVESLISARSRLRESMLDALHAAEIEIVSPGFMNSRVYSVDREFIPKPSRRAVEPAQTEAEAIAFDKAAAAASLEALKTEIQSIDEEIAGLTNEPGNDHENTIAGLEARKSRLEKRVDAQEKRLNEAEQTD